MLHSWCIRFGHLKVSLTTRCAVFHDLSRILTCNRLFDISGELVPTCFFVGFSLTWHHTRCNSLRLIDEVVISVIQVIGMGA